MRLILASLLMLVVCGCGQSPPQPMKRVSLYLDNGVTRYWLTRNFYVKAGFANFRDEETGEWVGVSGNVIVEVEHDSEKP